jgi:hypothetical protein
MDESLYSVRILALLGVLACCVSAALSDSPYVYPSGSAASHHFLPAGRWPPPFHSASPTHPALIWNRCKNKKKKRITLKIYTVSIHLSPSVLKTRLGIAYSHRSICIEICENNGGGVKQWGKV